MLFSNKLLLLARTLVGAVHGQETVTSDSVPTDTSTGVVTDTLPGVTTEFSFSPGLAIPGSGTSGEVQDDVTITDDIIICDLKLRVNIEHTWTSDLEIKLQHDDTLTTAWLQRDDCGSSDDLVVTFSDDATNDLDGASSSNSLCDQDNIEVKPEETLSIFDGLSTQGEWTLIINDDASADTGTLNEWALIVEACDTSSTTDPTDDTTYSGTGMGDPHFQTWDGSWFDFHGECDLVYIDNPHFAGGTGLAVHMRTTSRYEYSYIESAVVKIGDDTLQVNSFGSYFLNGISAGEMPANLAEFPVSYKVVDDKTHLFEIDLGDEQMLVIETYKDLVSVKITGARADSFKNSRGLLGEFGTGAKLGRDRKIIEDANAFGNEWQVLPSDGMLFHNLSEPQFPRQCFNPDKPPAQLRKRRRRFV